jgi:hypothetical protein
VLGGAVARAQAAENNVVAAESAVTKATQPIPERAPVEREIMPFGMISYGNYRIFGAAPRANIYTAGVEYDHLWGHWLKAQIDYVVEFLPVVMLNEPTLANFWGGPLTDDQQWVPGLGLSPFGFRFLWRRNVKVKPYMMGKAGIVAFPKKILSPQASYANFNFQGEFGLSIRMSDRTDFRIAPVNYFHVSNGYMARSNPGFDQLGVRFGVSYHLKKKTPGI